MDLEQLVVAAIAKSLSTRLDELNRRHLVAALSMPVTALGRKFKNALLDEQRQKQTATQKSPTR